jgi:hypothetical protein
LSKLGNNSNYLDHEICHAITLTNEPFPNSENEKHLWKIVHDKMTTGDGISIPKSILRELIQQVIADVTIKKMNVKALAANVIHCACEEFIADIFAEIKKNLQSDNTMVCTLHPICSIYLFAKIYNSEKKVLIPNGGNTGTTADRQHCQREHAD